MPSACRCFVISGYFSYMLFLRYPLKRWWKVRVERVGIPMLTAIPLLTLPQFIMLQHVKGKAENWPNLSFYEKYNTGLGANFPPLVPAGTGGANHGEFADLQPAAPARE